MKKHLPSLGCLIVLFLIIVLPKVGAQNPLFYTDTSYLSKHDIVYQTPPYEGFEGLPLGNGDMGGLIWNNKNGIEAQINKVDLYDLDSEDSQTTLRGGVRLSIDLGAPGFEWIYLDEFDGRLSLKDAKVKLNAKTPFMNSKLSSWIATNKNVWCFDMEVTTDQKLAEGVKMNVSLERWGSRTFPGWYGRYSKDTQNGLGNALTSVVGQDIILEEKFNGLSFAVACRLIGVENQPQIVSSHRVELLATKKHAQYNARLIVSMVTSNESANPKESAIKLLDQFEQNETHTDEKLHKEWWTEFWNKSFVHLGDDYIENIYYLRRYLMGSASRGMFPMPFNGGIWTWNHDVRNWVTPHHWNTQQQYWGLCAQNDCQLMLPYLDTYFRMMPQAQEFAKQRGATNAILIAEPHDFFGDMTFWQREDMINNFTPASQIALYFWEYYQFTQDKEYLKQKAFPFMSKAAEFYVQKLEWDDITKEYFIFPSQPYESPRSNNLKNPITDRNMILALMSACIEAAQITDTNKDKIDEWNKIIHHIWPIPYSNIPSVGEVIELASYPDGSIFPKMEERGAWLNHFAANTSLAFPANLVGIDDADTREYKALCNIIANHSPKLNAISPNPIVAARLGLSNEVMRMIQSGIRRLQHFPQGMFYNIDHWHVHSLYNDSLSQPDISAQRDYLYDQRVHYPSGIPAKPFIQFGFEPMSIYGTAINEMLLQSNEGKIRVFPATPANWRAAFKLRARGAFIVSSKKLDNGEVAGVYIESLKGNVCKLENPWSNTEILVTSFDKKGKKGVVKYTLNNGKLISFPTKADCQYLITNKKLSNIDKSSYKSTPNQSPKTFYEASLGKKRNF